MKNDWLRREDSEPTGRYQYRYRWNADHENGFDETVLTFDERGKLLSIDSRPLPPEASKPGSEAWRSGKADVPIPFRPEPE